MVDAGDGVGPRRRVEFVDVDDRPAVVLLDAPEVGDPGLGVAPGDGPPTTWTICPRTVRTASPTSSSASSSSMEPSSSCPPRDDAPGCRKMERDRGIVTEISRMETHGDGDVPNMHDVTRALEYWPSPPRGVH